MSKATHTPGPWEIEPKERRDHPLFVADGEGNRIARCDGLNISDFGPTPEQAKANARLIAAAPRLLDVCKTALSYFGKEPAMTGVQMFETLKGAVAKAEGA